ncbi:MAG: gliding motility-associated ABC transporter ATP-binding subunit GldA [Cytophagaceae bacterium]|nr:gliding motility-associated ABC transporter ATP-binding subunit GldA [Cytophagaceae bacterium]
MSISALHVTKMYGEQKALDDVSFTINKGEITGFLGPNGAGKSTMMRILTTYLAPDAGETQVNDHNTVTEKFAVQKSIGYLPENNPLYYDMYVREYLKFNAQIYKTPKERIEEVIGLTGLAPEAHKKIGQLSKGYKQRVGLASALLHDPDVLILDEPTTGLDPNQLMDIRKLIKDIGSTKTVLLSTHIMQEVEAICDRVIIISKGRIVADKNLRELQEKQEQTLIVEFDYRVEEVALERLPHLLKMTSIAGFVYELTFDTQRDMRPAVFDFAHDNGLKILQLNKKNTSLEALFLELTTG